MERLMSLDEFVQQQRQALEKFEKKWRKEHETNPIVYPGSMMPGDWDEQLNFFDPSE